MLDNIIQYLQSIHPVLAAFYATVFTWLLTAIGAASVFIFNGANKKLMDTLLGFTGGVMLAASIWSLLVPAVSMSKGEGITKLLPTIIGVSLGVCTLVLFDVISSYWQKNTQKTDSLFYTNKNTFVMILVITLHNIPEGLAVGVLFGGVASGLPEASIAGGVVLALAIGIQNLPEGIAVAMPLKRIGFSKRKSFFYGQLTALVEPVAAIFGALAVGFFTQILPYTLAYAAGAMIFVVIYEVIPESLKNQNAKLATIGFISGFLIMMILDTTLG